MVGLTRLAIVVSHPIQYYAPLFRQLAQRVDLTVYFAHRATSADQARAGFGVAFDWDVDLLSGYRHVFLPNVAKRPSLAHFSGCDTPSIREHIEKGSFHAVIVTGWHLKTFLQTAIAAKRCRIPVLARGDSQLRTPRSILKKFVKSATYSAFLRLFNGGLYVGDRSREYWLHFGYPEPRLFFSPHCVDTEWFAARATTESGTVLRSQLGLPEDARVVLFAGKLLPYKRPLDIISAAAQLKCDGIKVSVLIAGSGPLESEMDTAAKAKGVAIYRLGFRNQTEMPAVYAAADVLVLPSDGHETWGLVANEALACGKPIIVSDAVGCAPDLAADRTAGQVFPMGDVFDLARALKEVLFNPPKPRAIAIKSEAYSIRAAIDGIMAALDAKVVMKPPRVRSATEPFR